MNKTVAIIVASVTAGILLSLAYVFCPPPRPFARKGEHLPRLILENNGTAYCRMQYCDFRFPLPTGCVIEVIGEVTGGIDTINGKLKLSTREMHPLNIQVYASLLEERGFKVDRWPDGSLQALSNPLGGRLGVEPNRSGAIVEFSYFGDY